MRSVFCILSAIKTFSSEQPDSSGEVDTAASRCNPQRSLRWEVRRLVV